MRNIDRPCQLGVPFVISAVAGFCKWKGSVDDEEFWPVEWRVCRASAGGDASSLIVIMHGWGADANDLADLTYPMSLRFPGAAFFVPNAPEPCSMNPMGRQWFDLADSSADLRPPVR